MRKIVLTSMLVLGLGLFVTSCDKTKKEEKSDAIEKVQEVEETKDVAKEEMHEHSEELALATYQCPMQCEGDKTYDKPGSCPKCKMDLKEVKNIKEIDEESHEEKMDDNDK